jgi:RNA polymerase sigma-70 factor, ECF subfamily
MDVAFEPVADEADLLRTLRAGDEGAYHALVSNCGGPMLAAARRILGNDEDARDAVQDAFLSAFRGLEGFDGNSRLSTWLHRIVINASLMKLRSRRRKPERLIDELLPRYGDDGHRADPESPWTETPDTLLQREEMRSLVRHCIEQLPENYRTVLILRDIEELDTEETARTLGLSEGVVKTRLHRARQALRTLIDPAMRGTSK